MKKFNLVLFISVLLSGFLFSSCNLMMAMESQKSIYLLPAEHGKAVLEKTSKANVFNLSVKADEGYFFYDKEISCMSGSSGYYYDTKFVLPLTKIKEDYYSFELTEDFDKKEKLLLSVLFLNGTKESSECYNVAFDIDYGNVSVQKGFYQPGETVEFLVAPYYADDVIKEGYPQVLKGEEVIEVKKDIKWSNRYSFEMPAGDVKVTVEFGSSSGSNSEKYKIIFDSLEHGKITAEKTEGIARYDTVMLTIVPDEGYKINDESIYIYYDGYNLCSGYFYPSSSRNAYQFTMPASDVHVYAEFIPE